MLVTYYFCALVFLLAGETANAVPLQSDSSLEQALANIKYKHIVAFGDSLTDSEPFSELLASLCQAEEGIRRQRHVHSDTSPGAIISLRRRTIQ